MMTRATNRAMAVTRAPTEMAVRCLHHACILRQERRFSGNTTKEKGSEEQPIEAQAYRGARSDDQTEDRHVTGHRKAWKPGSSPRGQEGRSAQAEKRPAIMALSVLLRLVDHHGFTRAMRVTRSAVWQRLRTRRHGDGKGEQDLQGFRIRLSTRNPHEEVGDRTAHSWTR